MKLFLHLVRKESRDARWHVLGGGIAIAALVAASYAILRWNQRDDRDGDLLVLWVALGAGLGGAAVAAEVFATDAASRRVETFALLPAGLGRAFAAKLATTFAATMILGTLAGICACAAAATISVGPTAQGAAEAFSESSPIVLLHGLGAVSVAALFAIVLEHSLGSVVCSVVVTSGALGACGLLTPWDEWGFRPEGPFLLCFTLPATVVVVAAAYAAFVHGPIHLGRRVRRAAIGLGASAAVLAAAGFAAAAAFDVRAELEPGDPATWISSVDASPDGRTACLMVGNGRVPAQSRAWLVDVATGRVTALPGRHRRFVGWTADGGVRCSDYATSYGRKVAEWIDTFDVATGKLRRVRSAEQEESEPWNEQWARFAKSPGGYVVEWRERGIKRTIDGAWSVAASPRPGRIVAWFQAHALVIDLDTGAERTVANVRGRGDERWLDEGRRLRWRDNANGVHVLDCESGAVTKLEPPAGHWGFFGDERYAAYHPKSNQVAILDLRDGRTVAGPWANRTVWFDRGNPRFAVLVTVNGWDAPRLVDCETGRESARLTRLRRSSLFAGHCVRGLPDGTFLVTDSRGLEVIDAEGRTLRTVVAAPGR